MKLPQEILAFKLLRRASCNIPNEETMIVLTGMNYDVKETLYNQAKQSLGMKRLCQQQVTYEVVDSVLNLDIDQDEARHLTAQEHKDFDNLQYATKNRARRKTIPTRSD